MMVRCVHQVVFISYCQMDRQHAERVVHLGTILFHAGYLVFLDDWKPPDEPWARFLNRMLD